MVPSLVYVSDANNANGTVANLNNNAMMHHFVLHQRSRTDTVCPGGLQGRSASASSPPATSAARCTCPAVRVLQRTDKLALISHLVNKAAVAKNISSRSSTSTAPPAARMRRRCGSTSTAAATPSTRPRSATTTRRRLDVDGERPDDRDVRAPARRRHHEQPGRAPTTAPLRATASRSRPSSSAATPTTTSAPLRPNNAPPADLTGATMCRSEGRYGTAWATGTQGNAFRGHLDTISVRDQLRPAAHQAGGGFPGRRRLLVRGSDMKVEFVHIPDPGAYNDKVLSMVAAGTPPDTGFIQFDIFPPLPVTNYCSILPTNSRPTRSSAKKATSSSRRKRTLHRRGPLVWHWLVLGRAAHLLQRRCF